MAERRDDEAPDDVRYAMDETRARLSHTADELGDALAARVDAARERVDAVKERVGEVRDKLSVGELVQRHPWPALGLALGLGVALAASGADTAAASATTEAAKRASRVPRDAVRRRRERAAHEHEARLAEPRGPGLIERLTDGILGAINLDGLVEQLRHAGGELPRDQQVSTNRLAGKDYWKG